MIKTLFSICLLLAAHTLPAQGKFYGGSGDGFATATITNNVLPVRILQFSATAADNGVNGLLLLSDVQQVCAVQFERSADGRVFVPATAAQTVTAGSPLQFHFNDAVVPVATAFYRAAVTRCDGSVLYTAALAVKTTGNGALYVAGAALYYQNMTPGTMLYLFNTAGQQVLGIRFSNRSGMITISHLQPGVYTAVPEGGAAVKLVVQQ